MAFLRLLALVALGLSGCGGLFYQPSDKVYTDPAARGFQWRPLAFPRPGGGELTAALVPGRGSDSGRGLVVHFHGNAQNMTAHWLAGQWFVLRGWDLLVWDWSGYGASDGEPSRAQTARDADAFLRFVSDSILPGRRGPLVLFGQSLGGAILSSAFVRWKDRDRTTLLLVEGSFASYRGIARDRVAQHWATWIAWPLVPLLVSDEDAPRKSLDRVSPTPFVVASCHQDGVVPHAFQREMHELAPGSRLWTVEGCGHLGAFRSDSTRTRLVRFLDSLDHGGTSP